MKAGNQIKRTVSSEAPTSALQCAGFCSRN